MFNCTIAMTDNYFRYGLLLLINEALAKYPFESTAILTDKLNEKTQVAFIDADSASFYSVFVQASYLKLTSPLTIFIISSSKNAFSPWVASPNAVAGILYKTDEKAEIKHKIRQVLNRQGSRVVDPLTPLRERPTPATANYFTPLTPCESVVIDLLKQGFTGKDISKILGRSEKTISGQKRSAMKKLGVCSNAALFRQIH